MAKWSRDKVEPQDINGGQEFTPNSDLTIAELNAMVNNSFYGVDFVEGMTEQPIVDNSDPDDEASVMLVPYVKYGKTFYKFKFLNIKGKQGIQGEKGEKGEVTNLPVGSLVTSTCELEDDGFHLADGSTLNVGGIYDAFCQYVIANQDKFPHFDTLTEWNIEYNTYGQCGKYVITDTYVKLPKITKMTESANSLSELGSAVKAGVPNIKGEFYPNTGGDQGTNAKLFQGGDYSGCFSYISKGSKKTATNTGGSYGTGALGFNANNGAITANIYRDDCNTVQPNTVKVYYYIVIGIVTKTDIQVNLDNVATDLNSKLGKADIARYPIQTWHASDYSSWYTIYNDSWKECGGIFTASGSVATEFSLTYNGIEFANTNYQVFANYRASSNNQYGQCFNLTKTGCTVKTYGGATNNWYAFGY